MTTPDRAQVTRKDWEALPPRYRTGSPGDGTAHMLRATEDLGTVLVPVEVVDRDELFPLGQLVATGYTSCCRPGFSRCPEANSYWEAGNAVYRAHGYDAWLKSLEPYSEHMEKVEAEIAARNDRSETENA